MRPSGHRTLSRNPAPAILIVEDDWALGALIAGSVRRLGCRAIGPAASVVHAIALLYGEAPDAALLGVTLGADTSYVIADALTVCGIPFAFIADSVDDRPDGDLPARFAGRAVLPTLFSPWALDEVLRSLVGAAPVAAAA